jgi:hypothetical protein
MSKENKSKEKRGTKRTDVIIIVALLAVSLISVLLLSLTRKEGAYVKIEIDGEVAYVLPLGENAKQEITKIGANGEKILTNRISIENGEVFMEYADCPDKTCIHNGKVRYSGESIICLPNRVAVIIISETDEGVDFVS